MVGASSDDAEFGRALALLGGVGREPTPRQLALLDGIGQGLATLEKAKIGTRVVSMPCREWFDAQSKSYKEKVLPAAVRARVSVEAATPFGWREVVGDAGEIVGIDHFGASADAVTLYEKFGITPAAVVKAAKASIKKAKG